MTTTVSAKISDELKEQLDDADINVSEVVRRALEAEVRRRRREDLRERAAELRATIDDAPSGEELAAVVRESREKR